MKGKGPGEEDKGGERGGGSAAVSSKFVGHTDMMDEEFVKGHCARQPDYKPVRTNRKQHSRVFPRHGPCLRERLGTCRASIGIPR